MPVTIFRVDSAVNLGETVLCILRDINLLQACRPDPCRECVFLNILCEPSLYTLTYTRACPGVCICVSNTVLRARLYSYMSVTCVPYVIPFLTFVCERFVCARLKGESRVLQVQRNKRTELFEHVRKRSWVFHSEARRMHTCKFSFKILSAVVCLKRVFIDYLQILKYLQK